MSDKFADGILITPFFGSRRCCFKASNDFLSSSVGLKRTFGLANRRMGSISSDNLGTEWIKYAKKLALDKASFFVSGKDRFLIFSNFSSESAVVLLDISKPKILALGRARSAFVGFSNTLNLEHSARANGRSAFMCSFIVLLITVKSSKNGSQFLWFAKMRLMIA